MLLINGARMCNTVGSNVNDTICVTESNIDVTASKKP